MNIENKTVHRPDRIVEIHITRKNGDHFIATIDEQDFPTVSKYKRWNVIAGYKGRHYCGTAVWRPEQNNCYRVALPRILLGESCKGKEVTYRDGNPFHCTRANLRVNTHKELDYWRPTRGISGHRGVFYDNNKRYYRIQVSVDGKMYRGWFRELGDAIKRRDEILVEHGAAYTKTGQRIRALSGSSTTVSVAQG